MIDDVAFRNMSPNTQKVYAYAVANFARFHGLSPDTLSARPRLDSPLRAGEPRAYVQPAPDAARRARRHQTARRRSLRSAQHGVPPAQGLRRRAARPGAGHSRSHGAGPRVSRDPRRLPVSWRSEDSDRVRRAARARRPALRAATSVRLSARARDRARNRVVHDGQRGRRRLPARANAGGAGPRGPDVGAGPAARRGGSFRPRAPTVADHAARGRRAARTSGAAVRSATGADD